MKTRLRHITMTAIVIAVSLTVVWFVRTHVHVYDGLNSGIVVDSPAGNGCAGIEVKGMPGIYAYGDCRGL